MAFCAACGNEVISTAVVCVKCGSSVNGSKAVSNVEKWSTRDMIGISIATMIIPFVGLGFGIYGLTKEPKRTQGGMFIGLFVFMCLIWSIIQK